MELMKPKPKAKRKKLIIVQDAASTPEKVNVVEDQTEDIGSWEDLHTQTQDIELLYPSAPTGPIMHLSEQQPMYPVAPLLTMDSNLTFNLHTLMENQLIYPSAPQFEEKIDLQPTCPENNPAQLESDTVKFLEELYQNPLEEEFYDIIQDFRNSMNNGGDGDEFYTKLREYELSVAKLIESKRRVEKLNAQIQSFPSQFWTLDRSPVNISQTCPDGSTLNHTFINEIAVFHSELLPEFQRLLHRLKEETYIVSTMASFAAKVIYFNVVFKIMDTKQN